MRLLAGLLLAVLLLCGLACAALALGQRRFLYPGAFSPPTPWPVPPGVATITVATSDGETLHGLWRPPRPGCGVIVSFHGNGSRPKHAERFAAEPWRARGWGLLTVAYRGYPGSTGSPSEDGLIRDGLAAVNAARGTGARCADPAARPFAGGGRRGRRRRTGADDRALPGGPVRLDDPHRAAACPASPHLAPARHTYRSDTRIRGGTAPVLIVQGRDDTVVPLKLAQGLAAAAGPRARIAVIPGDHVSILGGRDREAEAMFRERVGPTCPQPVDQQG